MAMWQQLQGEEGKKEQQTFLFGFDQQSSIRTTIYNRNHLPSKIKNNHRKSHNLENTNFFHKQFQCNSLHFIQQAPGKSYQMFTKQGSFFFSKSPSFIENLEHKQSLSRPRIQTENIQFPRQSTRHDYENFTVKQHCTLSM